MFLKSLSLFNYKNFESKSLHLTLRLIALLVQMELEKRTFWMLFIIYPLERVTFNPIASQNIKHGEDFFVVDGIFDKEEREEKIVVSLKKGQKKIIKRNAKAYEKFSDHIGFIPLVIISPADRDLIIEGSDTTRKFIDSVISQSDKTYLSNLIKYNKVLSQRNALLKYFALNNTFNAQTLRSL